jgi:coenzyme F420-reducing hydrogenase delta subunit
MKMKTADDIKVQSERYKDWQPRIRLFCCQCAGGGAALRMDMPDEFLSEFVPFTSKIDLQHLLKTFEGGADAVFIIGCPPGECKMAEGNLRAEIRAAGARRMLDERHT